jgi:hypothetical protein
MHLAASGHDLRTSSKAVSTGERRGNPTKEQHVQKNQNQQGQQPPQQGSNSSQGRQQPGQSGNQQSQSGGSRDQQGNDLKSDQGQAQSRNLQQGNDHGNRSNQR